MENLLNLNDLSDLFAELDQMEDTKSEPTEEELASQRRYEEIIRKHRSEN